MRDIEANGIKIYDFANIGESEGEGEMVKGMLPFAVVGASFPHTDCKRGRQYSWGFVNVDDPKHSDLTNLRRILLRYYMKVAFNA